MKEQMIGYQAVRDQAAKEKAAKEKAARELAAKEQAAKEKAAKEKEAARVGGEGTGGERKGGQRVGGEGTGGERKGGQGGQRVGGEEQAAKTQPSSRQIALPKSTMGVIRPSSSQASRTDSAVRPVSRMTASESDLYMLNAETGAILHASFTSRSLELDTTFDCKPGPYGGYQVGTIVDILALPKVNAVGAGASASTRPGNLLYCTRERCRRSSLCLPPPTPIGAPHIVRPG